MKFKHTLLPILLSLVQMSYGQGILEDYKSAEQWMPNNVQEKIYNSFISPQWAENSSVFTYKLSTRKGTEFFVVNPDKATKGHAFDHTKLAKLLSERYDTVYDAWKLPFTYIHLDSNLKVNFSFMDSSYVYDSETKELKSKLQEANSRKESKSPNGEFTAFIKDYNLFLINNTQKDTTQLTKDGIEKYDYAAELSWYYIRNESKNEAERSFIVTSWSPDSKWLIVPRYDRRKAQRLYLMKTTPESGFRADVYSYERPLAGDSIVATLAYYAFNLETGKSIKLDFSPQAPYQEEEIRWLKDEEKAWTLDYSRGFTSCNLLEIDPITGKKRSIISEKSPTSYIDPMLQQCRVLENSKEIIWSSERDGWHHLYLYDYKSGKLKHQITKGEFVVHRVESVDTLDRKIYFRAFGKEKDRDPYYSYLYEVNFDGSGLKLLTPENAYHYVRFSPKGDYFLDNYSRVDLPNHTVLYSSKNSKSVLQLETADIEDLVDMGWKAPEPFKIKGRDGKTDVYGLIYRPYNFDPTKKYPVIDATYTGPHTIRSPKTFGRSIYNDDISLAQLGFIVVTVDGFGSAFRSKEFHDYSYKNLGDIGGPDHMKAIKELGEKYPYIDASNVGIYGHSAGGYDAVRALLAYPDFYKVAVSSAGNHDHRIAKAWWPELYMGYPAGKHYDEQSNFTNAKNLEGKLLLVHGNMDQNVNPAGTLRMADALVEANKDFDLLIINDINHTQLYDNKYFIRRRWDFFVKHLQGITPPKEYKIK